MSAIGPSAGGESNLNPGLDAQSIEVPEWFRIYLRAGLADVLRTVPKEFETWMADRVSVLGLPIPISQISGFTQFTPQSAEAVNTEETTTSTNYTSLSTEGPELTGLPDGTYLFIWTHYCKTSAITAVANSSIAFNSEALGTDDTNAASNANTNFTSVIGFAVKTFATGGNNRALIVYRVGAAGTGTWGRRRLFALKVANA